ncbi:MAG: hypothetical protein HC794_01795 [Nitrospiraceae bacterium]|nr:hypothetical protein [Nitrospiraceae bacterium]
MTDEEEKDAQEHTLWRQLRDAYTGPHDQEAWEHYLVGEAYAAGRKAALEEAANTIVANHQGQGGAQEDGEGEEACTGNR